MNKIRIYDVATRVWYSQNATGSDKPDHIPDARAFGCSSFISAADNSSYNIYMFGGEREIHGARTEDMWILSLPSFTWINVGDDDTGAVLNVCRRVGRQMCFVGSGNVEEKSRPPFPRILDMTSLEWRNTYSPNSEEYVLPAAIYAALGGNEAGGTQIVESREKEEKLGCTSESFSKDSVRSKPVHQFLRN